jgi:glycosyltransferase involved in cell wall biosynthesis
LTRVEAKSRFCGAAQLRIVFIKGVDVNPTEVDTLRHLAGQNIEVEIAAYGNNPGREAQNQKIFSSQGITFNHITKYDISTPNKLAAKITAYVIRSRPQVVVPTEVYYRHSILLSLLHHRSYSYTFQNIIKRSRSIPVIKKFSRMIVPVSSTAKIWIRCGFPSKKIHVIPFGVDTSRFAGVATNFDEPRILYVGRVTEEKGLTYLLYGLSRLKVPFEARIVGGGEAARFVSLASRLRLGSRIKFVPFVERENLHEYYSWSNIFVLPSITTLGWAEQLGMALMEAMAYGRLVIGTMTGAIPDVIGDSGILVKERSAYEIAKAIEWVNSNPDRAIELARKSRKRVIREFDARVCAMKMYQVFTGRGEFHIAQNDSV